MKLSLFITNIKYYFRKKKNDYIYWKNNAVVRVTNFFKKRNQKYTNDDIDPLVEEENLIIFNYN